MTFIKKIITNFIAGIILYILLCIVIRVLCFLLLLAGSGHGGLGQSLADIGQALYDLCFEEQGGFWAVLFRFKAWLFAGCFVGIVQSFK